MENTEDLTEEIMEDGRVLIAVYPILFHSHQYQIGDELPANYPDMVDAWIQAGTAVWGKTEHAAPKATPATAETGISGNAVTSDSEGGEDLVGKVPRTVRRSKK